MVQSTFLKPGHHPHHLWVTIIPPICKCAVPANLHRWETGLRLSLGHQELSFCFFVSSRRGGVSTAGPIMDKACDDWAKTELDLWNSPNYHLFWRVNLESEHTSAYSFGGQQPGQSPVEHYMIQDHPSQQVSALCHQCVCVEEVEEADKSIIAMGFSSNSCKYSSNPQDANFDGFSSLLIAWCWIRSGSGEGRSPTGSQ